MLKQLFSNYLVLTTVGYSLVNYKSHWEKHKQFLQNSFNFDRNKCTNIKYTTAYDIFFRDQGQDSSNLDLIVQPNIYIYINRPSYIHIDLEFVYIFV